ncbi:hypothetical protein ACLMJK_003043 [Lecanora helva]
MSVLSVYTLTYNCGRVPIAPTAFSTHLFSALPPRSPPPDILVLCLQELAPISYSFLGGSYLIPYLSPFHHAVSIAGQSLDKASYVNIITRNVGMTAIMIFVLRDQTSQVRWLETAGVGVGMQEMGNKGAVGVKIGWSIQDSTLDFTFVSAHLAPMEDALERRNEDWKNIVRRLVFTPVSPTTLRQKTTQRLPSEPSPSDTEPLLPSSSPDGKSVESDSIPPMTGLYTPSSHLVLSGDLNYRTSTTPPTPTTHLTFPQPTKDPSAPQHYSHLLQKDQLTPERLANRTCHGLSEAPISFPPTYKYSDKARHDATTFDDEQGHWEWSKHRYPSWCDRVLYLDLPPWSASNNEDHKIKVQSYKALPLMATSDHRPVACSFLIPAEPISEPTGEQEEEAKEDVRLAPPFGLDPLWKEKREAARRKEVVVGVAAYLGLTWEGRGVLVAVVVGALGGWAIVRSLLEV